MHVDAFKFTSEWQITLINCRYVQNKLRRAAEKGVEITQNAYICLDRFLRQQ